MRQPKTIRGGGKVEKANTRGKQKAWKPLTKEVTVMVEEVGGGMTGTLFARGAVFNKKPLPDKDSAEKKTTKNHECVVHLRFKVLHGSTDVQEMVVGLNETKLPASSTGRRHSRHNKWLRYLAILPIFMTTGACGMKTSRCS